MESVQYGLDELKTKALRDIKTKLTSENILFELFSTITSTYVIYSIVWVHILFT